MLHHSILETLPEGLRGDALSGLQPLRFEQGKILFRAGDPCQGLPLVLNGSVKVQMTGLSGNRPAVVSGQRRWLKTRPRCLWFREGCLTG